MKKFIYKDDVYYYKIRNDSHYTKLAYIYIYNKNSGFWSCIFKYDKLLCYSFNKDVYETTEDIIKKAFEVYKEKNKVLLIDCSPEVEDLFNR